VGCGSGRDMVVVTRGDTNDQIAEDCERVVRR
jgi:hypothetical protein